MLEQFRQTDILTRSQAYETTLLPRALAAIIRTFNVEEVHLSLTNGRWNYERWQEPIGHGAASGGEIHAWLATDESETEACVLMRIPYSSSVNFNDYQRTLTQRWAGLTNSLGGLFCSSLNNLDGKITTSPVATFFPADPTLEGQPFFHALLPLEHPCTENLTPFVSLLPCKSAAGLAQLLNPHKLFDADWQKLGVHITRHAGTVLQIKLEFELVQDPVRMTLAAGSQPRRGK